MSNFPDDGTPTQRCPPDSSAALEPWHFTNAQCSVVIYYKILSIFPYAIQKDLVFLYFIHNSVYLLIPNS